MDSEKRVPPIESQRRHSFDQLFIKVNEGRVERVCDVLDMNKEDLLEYLTTENPELRALGDHVLAQEDGDVRVFMQLLIQQTVNGVSNDVVFVTQEEDSDEYLTVRDSFSGARHTEESGRYMSHQDAKEMVRGDTYILRDSAAKLRLLGLSLDKLRESEDPLKEVRDRLPFAWAHFMTKLGLEYPESLNFLMTPGDREELDRQRKSEDFGSFLVQMAEKRARKYLDDKIDNAVRKTGADRRVIEARAKTIDCEERYTMEELQMLLDIELPLWAKAVEEMQKYFSNIKDMVNVLCPDQKN
ncbi:hypothetical protein C0581_00885 [Candidatus Parcubacteria bacterium]|nr:MAG: hypothetical protein C0581_00885 [Candidatus Parcubacteria bacterium]